MKPSRTLNWRGKAMPPRRNYIGGIAFAGICRAALHKTYFLCYNINMTTLEIKKINTQVKALVSRAISDVFSDPDFGLELTSKAQKRLSASKTGKTISLSQLKRKYI